LRTKLVKAKNHKYEANKIVFQLKRA
jgi:hypothetical protein